MQKGFELKNFNLNIKNFFKSIMHNKTVIVCFILSLIYFASGYCKWLEIAVFVLGLAFMFVFSAQQAFCIFLFLHNFTLSNNGYDSWFVATIIGFSVVMLVKYLIGLKKQTYKFYKQITFLIIAFLLFSTLLSIGKPLFYNAWIYYTYLPIVYFIFAMRKDFNVHQSINYLFGGLITSFGIAAIARFLPLYQYNVFFSNRFRAFINHPNYLYMRALFVLSYFMFYYLKGNLSKIKVVLIYLLCTIITLSTLSKTGAVMLLSITAIFVLLYLKSDFKRHIKILSIFILCLLLLFACCYKFVFSTVERFLTDFNSNDIISSVLTGRDEIWFAYLKKTFSSPITALFGNGLLTERVYIPSHYDYKETHNLYLFLLYRFGIVGTVLLAYIVYLFIKEVYTTKPKLISFLPLIFVLIESLVDNTFKCYNIIYFVLAAMTIFHQNEENRVKKTQEI